MANTPDIKIGNSTDLISVGKRTRDECGQVFVCAKQRGTKFHTTTTARVVEGRRVSLILDNLRLGNWTRLSPVHRLTNRHSSSRQTLGSSAFSSTFNFVMLFSQRTLKRRMEIPDALSTRLIRAFRRSTTQTVMHLPLWQICGPRSGASLVRCDAHALQALLYPLQLLPPWFHHWYLVLLGLLGLSMQVLCVPWVVCSVPRG